MMSYFTKKVKDGQLDWIEQTRDELKMKNETNGVLNNGKQQNNSKVYLPSAKTKSDLFWKVKDGQLEQRRDLLEITM